MTVIVDYFFSMVQWEDSLLIQWRRLCGYSQIQQFFSIMLQERAGTNHFPQRPFLTIIGQKETQTTHLAAVFSLKSDQYLMSPYNITPWITHESQKNEGNVHQIKKPKNVKTNSPCQHLRNSIETSKEIIHTDVRVNTVLMQQSKHLHLFL